MKKQSAIRAAALSAACSAALLGSTTLYAHDGPAGKVDEQAMMHQMEQVRSANRAMHEAPPERRGQALAEHRHGMRHMMQMMRMMHGNGMGGMDGKGGPGGMGMGMDDKMGSGDRRGMAMGDGPDGMRAMARRMDRMETMMAEMLDHMDMAESGGVPR